MTSLPLHLVVNWPVFTILSNTWYRQLTWVSHLSGISIGSAICAQLTHATNTDRQTDTCCNRSHLCTVCVWCGGLTAVNNVKKASHTRYWALGPVLILVYSHPPGCRLPLLFARPAVTFLAAEHYRLLDGTKLYCLVTEAHRCEQLAQGCYAAFAPSSIWTHDLLISSSTLNP